VRTRGINLAVVTLGLGTGDGADAVPQPLPTTGGIQGTQVGRRPSSSGWNINSI